MATSTKPVIPKVDGRERDVLASSVPSITDIAVECDIAQPSSTLKDGLDPLVVAGLTQVVDRFDGFWTDAIPCWGVLEAVNEYAVGELDKRVSRAVFKGVLEFGKLTTLLLQLRLQLRGEVELNQEVLLSLEQFVSDLADGRASRIEVTDSESRLRSVLERSQGAERRND
ncbi:hypothetical protein [Stenotrophomonas sp. AB1(2024)]|uniref:hypothetical protein n=1 Tax=Stenotrophomonas sp. AB1(2024) TaxID=3132215 RepID=UPI0030B75DED